MFRFKIYWFFIAILFFSLIFLIFQYFFYANLKQIQIFSVVEEKKPKEAQIKKNDQHIRGHTFFNVDQTSTDNSFLNFIKKNKIKVKKMKVPLNEHNEPYVAYMLPFKHRLNFNNYTMFIVEEEIQQSPRIDSTQRKNNFFVEIETEHRQIDKNALKKNYENLKIKTPDSHVDIKGIDKSKWYLYEPDSDGFFHCINSDQKISYSNLNDDFCDCVDGTDEPGTSACLFSRFFCDTQNEHLKEKIPSSKVDDRICDCCDGSDESEDVSCKNTCEEKVEKKRKKAQIENEAMRLKQKYIQEGLFKDERLYGPEGVFYRLQNQCYLIDWSEYTFEICPYKHVSQYKRNNKNDLIKIGSEPSLESVNNKKIKWVLKMNNGDPKFCGQPRRSEIHFNCGVEERIVQMQEPEKCVYVFYMNTPAAC